MWNEIENPSFEAKEGAIFVFGSNLDGRHGKGAALWALENCVAIYGQGFGLQGRSYAIPTKGRGKYLPILSLDIIRNYVMLFLDDARSTPETYYQVTPIGCGLAGYSAEQIAPMFSLRLANVELPKEFIEILEKN